MKIINSLLTKNPNYTKPIEITIKGLMLHSVGCPQPKASVFVRKWNKSTKYVCAHALIDGNSGDVYQTLPWNYRTSHAGSGKNGSANNNYVGVEMCEPSTIKYTSGANWVELKDGANTKETVMRTYKSAVELFAHLCKEYKLDPLASGVIISHSEGRKLGIASNHADVEHIWKKFGLTMTQFRKDVKKEIDKTTITHNIKKGDVVEIAPDAVYYSGKTIPKWVKNQKWVVCSVSGNRAVVNKNVTGTRSIMSPINTKYLTVVTNYTSTAGSVFKPYLVRVSIKNLNMRTGPATTYPRIGYIPQGIYTITKLSGKWGKLKAKQTYKGKKVDAWIYTDYTTKV